VTTTRLTAGPVVVDRLRQTATVDGAPLELTRKEFQVLDLLVQHQDSVVRRTTLLEKVWDLHFDPESNVVDVHVGHLRRKLERAGAADRLLTVRGVGYRLLG
jgi:two-component system OmpR family response regulator